MQLVVNGSIEKKIRRLVVLNMVFFETNSGTIYNYLNVLPPTPFFKK